MAKSRLVPSCITKSKFADDVVLYTSPRDRSILLHLGVLLDTIFFSKFIFNTLIFITWKRLTVYFTENMYD